MIQFSDIILASGLAIEDYPLASGQNVHLRDRKDREVTEKVTYVEPLFCHNPNAHAAFQKAVQVLEEHLRILSADDLKKFSLNMKIDENMVVLSYGALKPQFFLRRAPLDPMDYTD